MKAEITRAFIQSPLRVFIGAKRLFLASAVIILLFGCEEEEETTLDTGTSEGFFSEYSSRTFAMGFSTWAYAPTLESVDATYQFIGNNADIYSEHIDSNIPWRAWMNDLPLPQEFTDEIAGRAARKIPSVELTVSVSLLNSARDELAFDFDGTVPDYVALNDTKIEDAYFKHLEYITNQLNPDYLLIAIEVNELLLHAPEKWDAYKLLMANVRARIKQRFPSLGISESITLHNLYKPDVTNPEEFISEIVSYTNNLEFAAISFYPFFKGLKTNQEFQEAFDFLHQKINKPIAFAETSHLSEDLTVESFDLFIPGNESEQNNYLEALFTNAQKQNYEYIIWWAHRDYNELWETFPAEVQDLGKIWISTGIINEDGALKGAFSTWEMVTGK
ncbi:MAG: glycosyl hydrolase 53 family protein [Bacteroidota bacterium]